MDQVMIYSNTLFKVNKSFNFPWLTETYKFDFLSRHVRLTFNISEIKWLEFATELPANLTQVFPPRNVHSNAKRSGSGNGRATIGWLLSVTTNEPRSR